MGHVKYHLLFREYTITIDVQAERLVPRDNDVRSLTIYTPPYIRKWNVQAQKDKNKQTKQTNKQTWRKKNKKQKQLNQNN